MESVGAWYLSNHDDDVGYALIAAFEELGEKLAVILAIDTALRYLAGQFSGIHLTFSRQVASS
jgi:hypothetical protein